MTNFNICHFYQ